MRAALTRLVALTTLLQLTSCATLARREPIVPAKLTNPVLAGDHPDPQIFWHNGAYTLAYTAGSQLVYKRSPDLISWSESQVVFANPDGAKPMLVNGKGFCNVWAPEFFPSGKKTLLLFSAQGFEEGKVPERCPPFQGATAIYWTESEDGLDGFGKAANEPAALGWNPDCKHENYPHARPAPTCLEQACENFPRLDGSYFRQGERLYLAYSWFTNPAPKTRWEKKNHGVSLSVREMPADRPTVASCNEAALVTLHPGDKTLERQLAKSCPRCYERMSFSKDVGNLPLQWAGAPGGILEGPSLFQRGDYVYLLFSHSGFQSAYYSVSWIAAKTVAGLAKPERLVGRYLIPSGPYAFGHGSPLQLAEKWFYAYHRIDAESCAKETGRRCERDVFVSPMEFEDRGDGKGDVWLKARYPEQDREVTVTAG